MDEMFLERCRLLTIGNDFLANRGQGKGQGAPQGIQKGSRKINVGGVLSGGEEKGKCEGWLGISPRVGDSPPGLWDPPGSPLIRVLPGAPWLIPRAKSPGSARGDAR